MTKPVAIVVFGPQGSGKSTQAEYLAKYFQMPLFQSGEESRKFALGPTKEARRLRLQLKRGGLTPPQIMEKLLRNFLLTNDVSRGVIFDGFPRSLQQARLLNRLATDFNWLVIGVVVEISEETTFKRLAKRVIIRDGRAVAREDDNPESIRQRLKIYRRETLPVLQWFASHHQLLAINGELSIEEVSRELVRKLNQAIAASR